MAEFSSPCLYLASALLVLPLACALPSLPGAAQRVLGTMWWPLLPLGVSRAAYRATVISCAGDSGDRNPLRLSQIGPVAVGRRAWRWHRLVHWVGGVCRHRGSTRAEQCRAQVCLSLFKLVSVPHSCDRCSGQEPHWRRGRCPESRDGQWLHLHHAGRWERSAVS